MHEQAYSAVEQMVVQAREAGWPLHPDRPIYGMDIGGQDVNGTARAAVPGVTRWDSYDLHDPTATYVGDARTGMHSPDDNKPEYMVGFCTYQVVLCTEVLEHVRWWPLVVRTAFEMATPGALVLITAAAPPRGAHSAQGLDVKPDDEWYENIDPEELRALVEDVFHPEWVKHAYRASPGDVYLCARAAA